MFTKKSMDKWILAILQSKNLSDKIIALNFGYFQSNKGNMVYCIGSKEYDKEDTDWACNEDFIPKDKYYKPEKVFARLNWSEFDIRMNDIIKTVIDSNASLIPSSIKHICSGYDDGDLTLIWERK